MKSVNAYGRFSPGRFYHDNILHQEFLGSPRVVAKRNASQFLTLSALALTLAACGGSGGSGGAGGSQSQAQKTPANFVLTPISENKAADQITKDSDVSFTVNGESQEKVDVVVSSSTGEKAPTELSVVVGSDGTADVKLPSLSAGKWLISTTVGDRSYDFSLTVDPTVEKPTAQVGLVSGLEASADVIVQGFLIMGEPNATVTYSLEKNAMIIASGEVTLSAEGLAQTGELDLVGNTMVEDDTSYTLNLSITDVAGNMADAEPAIVVALGENVLQVSLEDVSDSADRDGVTHINTPSFIIRGDANARVTFSIASTFDGVSSDPTISRLVTLDDQGFARVVLDAAAETLDDGSWVFTTSNDQREAMVGFVVDTMVVHSDVLIEKINDVALRIDDVKKGLTITGELGAQVDFVVTRTQDKRTVAKGSVQLNDEGVGETGELKTIPGTKIDAGVNYNISLTTTDIAGNVLSQPNAINFVTADENTLLLNLVVESDSGVSGDNVTNSSSPALSITSGASGRALIYAVGPNNTRVNLPDQYINAWQKARVVLPPTDDGDWTITVEQKDLVQTLMIVIDTTTTKPLASFTGLGVLEGSFEDFGKGLDITGEANAMVMYAFTDNGVTLVSGEVTLDASGMANTGSLQLVPDVMLKANHTHTLELVSEDVAGNTSFSGLQALLVDEDSLIMLSVSETQNVSSTNPSLVRSSTPELMIFGAPEATVMLTAQSDEQSLVLDDVKLNSIGRATISPQLSDGKWTLTASVNNGTQDETTLTVDTMITLPSAIFSYSGSSAVSEKDLIKGFDITSDLDTTITYTVYQGSRDVIATGSVMVDASGIAQTGLLSLKEGTQISANSTYYLTLRAEDIAGNTQSTPLTALRVFSDAPLEIKRTLNSSDKASNDSLVYITSETIPEFTLSGRGGDRVMLTLTHTQDPSMPVDIDITDQIIAKDGAKVFSLEGLPPLSDGAWTLLARTNDESSTVMFIVDSTVDPSTVTITGRDGLRGTSDDVGLGFTLSGEAGAIASVRITDDMNTLYTHILMLGTDGMAQTPELEGIDFVAGTDYRLELVVTDAVGNRLTQMAEITILEQNSVGVMIRSASNSDDQNADDITPNSRPLFTLTGNGDEQLTITLVKELPNKEDITLQNTITLDASGMYTFTAPFLEDGTWDISVVGEPSQDDPDGARTHSDRFVVDTVDPDITVRINGERGLLGHPQDVGEGLVFTGEPGNTVDYSINDNIAGQSNILLFGMLTLDDEGIGKTGSFDFGEMALTSGQVYRLNVTVSDRAGNNKKLNLPLEVRDSSAISIILSQDDDPDVLIFVMDSTPDFLIKGYPGAEVKVTAMLQLQQSPEIDLGIATVGEDGTTIFTASTLVDGTYTVYAAVSEENSAETVVVVDTMAPVQSFVTFNENSGDGSVLVKTLRNGFVINGEAEADVEYTLQRADKIIATGTATIGANGLVAVSSLMIDKDIILDEGQYTLSLETSDKAGNKTAPHIQSFNVVESFVIGLNIAEGFDRGSSNTDSITNISKPTFTISSLPQISVMVTITMGSQSIIVDDVVTDIYGQARFTASYLSDGQWTVLVSAAGASTYKDITIDTVATFTDLTIAQRVIDSDLENSEEKSIFHERNFVRGLTIMGTEGDEAEYFLFDGNTLIAHGEFTIDANGIGESGRIVLTQDKSDTEVKDDGLEPSVDGGVDVYRLWVVVMDVAGNNASVTIDPNTTPGGVDITLLRENTLYTNIRSQYFDISGDMVGDAVSLVNVSNPEFGVFGESNATLMYDVALADGEGTKVTSGLVMLNENGVASVNLAGLNDGKYHFTVSTDSQTTDIDFVVDTFVGGARAVISSDVDLVGSVDQVLKGLTFSSDEMSTVRYKIFKESVSNTIPLVSGEVVTVYDPKTDDYSWSTGEFSLAVKNELVPGDYRLKLTTIDAYGNTLNTQTNRILSIVDAMAVTLTLQEDSSRERVGDNQTMDTVLMVDIAGQSGDTIKVTLTNTKSDTDVVLDPQYIVLMADGKGEIVSPELSEGEWQLSAFVGDTLVAREVFAIDTTAPTLSKVGVIGKQDFNFTITPSQLQGGLYFVTEPGAYLDYQVFKGSDTNGVLLLMSEGSLKVGDDGVVFTGEITEAQRYFTSGDYTLRITTQDVSGNSSERLIDISIAPDLLSIMLASEDNTGSSAEAITSNSKPSFTVSTQSNKTIKVTAVNKNAPSDVIKLDTSGSLVGRVFTFAPKNDLDDGEWIITARVGGSEQSVEVVIDSQSDAVGIALTASDSSYLSDFADIVRQGFTFSGQARSQGIFSFHASANPDVAIARGDFVIGLDGMATSGTLDLLQPIVSGTSYELKVIITDIANNVEQRDVSVTTKIERSFSFTLDRASDSGLLDSDLITNNAVLMFTLVGNADQRVVVVATTDDAQVIAPAQILDQKGDKVFITDRLDDGVWTITANASDGDVLSLEVTVDTMAPNMPEVSFLGIEGRVSSLPIARQGLVIRAEAESTVRYTVQYGEESLSGVVVVGVDGTVKINPFNEFMALNAGVYNVTATAQDVAGNVSESFAGSIEILTDIPVMITLDNTSDTGLSMSDGITMQANAVFALNGTAGDNVTITATNGDKSAAIPNQVIANDGSASFATPVLSDGTWSITARGTSNSVSMLDVTIDTMVPLLPEVSLVATEGLVGSTAIARQGLVIRAEAGSTVAYTVQHGSETIEGMAVVGVDGTVKVNPFNEFMALNAGVYNVTTTAQDVAGNVSESFAGSIEILTDIPVMIALDDNSDTGLSMSDGITMETNLMLVLEGLAGDNVTITATNGDKSVVIPNQVVANDGSARFATPVLSDGTWFITARGASNSVSMLDVTIDTMAPLAPEVSLVGGEELVGSIPIAHQGLVIRAEANATVAYSVQHGGETIDGMAVVGIDGTVKVNTFAQFTDVNAGLYMVTVTAQDVAGNVSESFNRSIEIVENIPVMVTLDGNSDTGISMSDGITMETNLMLVLEGTSGDTIRITVVNGDMGGSLVHNQLLANDGSAIFSTPVLSDGTWSITARGISNFVSMLEVTIDTMVPLTPQVSLVGTEGLSGSLVIVRQGLVIRAEANAIVTYAIQYDDQNIEGMAVVGVDGTVKINPFDQHSNLNAGSYALSIIAQDVAGNLSKSFTGLIDVRPNLIPTVSLADQSDTGEKDGITSRNKVIINVMGTPFDEISLKIGLDPDATPKIEAPRIIQSDGQDNFEIRNLEDGRWYIWGEGVLASFTVDTVVEPPTLRITQDTTYMGSNDSVAVKIEISAPEKASALYTLSRNGKVILSSDEPVILDEANKLFVFDDTFLNREAVNMMEYTIKVTVTDIAGNTQEFNYNISLTSSANDENEGQPSSFVYPITDQKQGDSVNDDDGFVAQDDLTPQENSIVGAPSLNSAFDLV